MQRSCKKLASVTLAIVGLSALAGCVDEKIVFRDRDLFEEPLAAAGSFLGYSDGATQLTVCGNCHVEKQGDWEGTGHASAWEGLQANPGAQAFCEGCHTVNELGNTVDVAAGHNVTGEERYYDVQCESCHGPGENHMKARFAAAAEEGAADNPVVIPEGELLIPTEATCRGCHNDESPSFEKFCFYEMVAKVRHLRPDSSQEDLLVCGCGDACACVHACEEGKCAVPAGEKK